MIRDFTPEKKEELYKTLDAMDNRGWEPFMEWCGPRKSEFGEWADRLGIVSYMSRADEYQQEILDTNESTKTQIDAVFENVAETDRKYAEIFRDHAEAVRRQMGLVQDLTMLMSAGAACRTGFNKALKSYKIKQEPVNRETVNGYAELDRYVNERILKIMGWNVEKFKETYEEDALEQLKEYMYQYGITDRYSICMFLATIGEESGDGTKLTEAKDENSDYSQCTYEFHTRGAGLMQVTGWDQKEFLEYIKGEIEADPGRADSGLKEEIQDLIDGYDNPPAIKIINGEEKENCGNSKDVTAFIAKNYPIESAVWYWATYKKCTYYEDVSKEDGESISLNEYVCVITENLDISVCIQHENALENVFLATQYYVNGSPWSHKRLQKVAECTDDTYHIGGKLTFTLPPGDPHEGEHEAALPKGWKDRAEDMHMLDLELFG